MPNKLCNLKANNLNAQFSTTILLALTGVKNCYGKNLKLYNSIVGAVVFSGGGLVGYKAKKEYLKKHGGVTNFVLPQRSTKTPTGVNQSTYWVAIGLLAFTALGCSYLCCCHNCPCCEKCRRLIRGDKSKNYAELESEREDPRKISPNRSNNFTSSGGSSKATTPMSSSNVGSSAVAVSHAN